MYFYIDGTKYQNHDKKHIVDALLDFCTHSTENIYYYWLSWPAHVLVSMFPWLAREPVLQAKKSWKWPFIPPNIPPLKLPIEVPYQEGGGGAPLTSKASF